MTSYVLLFMWLSTGLSTAILALKLVDGEFELREADDDDRITIERVEWLRKQPRAVIVTSCFVLGLFAGPAYLPGILWGLFAGESKDLT